MFRGVCDTRLSPDIGLAASMSREINIGSTLALDKQISETAAGIIQLKRFRNSLISIARIPPEILGYILYLSIVPMIPQDGNPRFVGLRKGSYNFLLVCHHWYEIARRTPELWSSWGSNLRDWKRRYLCSETSPLDLVLDGMEDQVGSFDGPLRDALRNRAARDVVRKVHLRSQNIDLLTSIVSSLTPEDEGIRHSSIESIDLCGVDLSDFFAQHRFPRLRDLSLFECLDLPWDHLKLHTMALTNLTLYNGVIPTATSIPTTLQILSLLASNPNIRILTLHSPVAGDDGGHSPRFQVPLHHLEQFTLVTNFHHGFPILQRLELPDRMEHMDLNFRGCTLEGTRRIIGPYIGDYLHRDTRIGGRPGVFVLSTANGILLQVSAVCTWLHYVDRLPIRSHPYATLGVTLSQNTSRQERDELCIDILALLPRERIVYLNTNLSTHVMEELLVPMPNIEALHLVDAVMPNWFLLPNAHRKLLPSLQWLVLENVATEDHDWDPLVRYLTRQTSGGQSVSLTVFGKGVHICTEVVKQIRDLVGWLVYDPGPGEECPFDSCAD
ncbi:hypothetical protein BDM02DRAFT_3271756 [Thelephora ganbajun]|uniref:Uncharacterized protein n=1 Tax=Thelephora ganbajun TaxID=370292 RepID=A0ACB6Z884_THEGA|nr:hypothetical protein BDM02DRAFT_3271756 [Thelephora ganbajun]